LLGNRIFCLQCGFNYSPAACNSYNSNSIEGHPGKKTSLNIKTMKNKTLAIGLLAVLTIFSACSVVGGIFKAGVGVGVFIVVIVIALIIFLVSRMGKK